MPNVIQPYTGTLPPFCTVCGSPYHPTNAETLFYGRTTYGWYDATTGAFVGPDIWCEGCEEARRAKLSAACTFNPVVGDYYHCDVCAQVVRSIAAGTSGGPLGLLCCGQNMAPGLP